VYLIAAIAALILAQTTPVPEPSASPSSNEILSHAIDRLHSYGTPPYVVYMTSENGENHRIAFRGSDEMMNDVPLPAGPNVPDARIYRAFVGPLSYSVHEAVSTPSPAASTSPSPPTQGPGDLESTLKTIAVVSSHGHLYDVSMRGAETLNGQSVYHIALKPRRDADKNTIRDLWIDTKTYDVIRADYIVPAPPEMADVVGSEADLTVNFETVGNYRIAAHWIAIYHAPTMRPFYRELRVVKMTFPGNLPDWLFDPLQYMQHRRAHDPDYLAHVFDAAS
jgi:hypothetical protein